MGSEGGRGRYLTRAVPHPPTGTTQAVGTLDSGARPSHSSPWHVRDRRDLVGLSCGALDARLLT